MEIYVNANNINFFHWNLPNYLQNGLKRFKTSLNCLFKLLKLDIQLKWENHIQIHVIYWTIAVNGTYNENYK